MTENEVFWLGGFSGWKIGVLFNGFFYGESVRVQQWSARRWRGFFDRSICGDRYGREMAIEGFIRLGGFWRRWWWQGIVQFPQGSADHEIGKGKRRPVMPGEMLNLAFDFPRYRI